MKIQGPSKTSATSKSSKTSKTSQTGGNFADMLTQASQESTPTAGTQAVHRVDALLAVQGVETATERGAKRRMRERGDQILRGLDQIRLGLLTGRLTLNEIINLADSIATHRENIDDPAMTAILDEIDLRAQIEIAKAKKAL